MSSPEGNDEALPLEVDAARTKIGKDGAAIQYATLPSIIESLEASQIGVLADSDAVWGEHTGPLAELLADCPLHHLQQLGRTGLMQYGMAAVAAAQAGFEE